jgi:hypothetical protein
VKGVLALLAFANQEEASSAARIRRAAMTVARVVLARHVRLIVHADAATLLPILLIGLELRESRQLETIEQSKAPVLMFGMDVSQELESTLLLRRSERVLREAESEEAPVNLLEALSAFNVVETRPGARSVDEWAEHFAREETSGVFLIGDAEPLTRDAALMYRDRSRIQLFTALSRDMVRPDEWIRVEDRLPSRDGWSVTMGGREVETGEDRELALAADEDARLAFGIEQLVDHLVPEPGRG